MKSKWKPKTLSLVKAGCVRKAMVINYGSQKSTMVIIEVDVPEFILLNLENNLAISLT